MRLKFEKNKIHCRISKIEADELLSHGALEDSVKFPSGHIFTYAVEITPMALDMVTYAASKLSFMLTRDTVEQLIAQPTKHGKIFLQDGVAYAFEIDIRKERRKKTRAI